MRHGSGDGWPEPRQQEPGEAGGAQTREREDRVVKDLGPHTRMRTDRIRSLVGRENFPDRATVGYKAAGMQEGRPVRVPQQ